MTNVLGQVLSSLLALIMSLQAIVGGLPAGLTGKAIVQTKQGQVLGVSTNGLVGYWNFDEGTGNTASDSSGFGNNGNITGASWVNGVLGKALNFTGSNVVTVPSSDMLNSDYLSVSFWINLSGNAAWTHVLSRDDSQWSRSYHIQLDGSGSRFYGFVVASGTIASLGANTAPSLNGWHHVVFTYDGNNQTFYLDGKQDGQKAQSGPMMHSTATLKIGAPNSISYSLDDIRIYNRALTSQEIIDIYVAGGGSVNPPTVSSFIASPATISPGQSSALNWATMGATSIAINPGSFTSTEASGSVTVTPTSSTAYTLTATNSAGSVGAVARVAVGGSGGGNSNLDQYGGSLSIKCTSTTGFFHVEKIGDRWWLCTPLGNGYFEQGVQLVSAGDIDWLGRNQRDLLLNKYGGWAGWAENTSLQLKSWGFNAIDVGGSSYVYPWFTDPSWPLDSNGLHSNPNKMPMIVALHPGRDAVRNVSFNSDNWTGDKVFLTEAVKNIVSGWSSVYFNSGGWPYGNVPDFYDPRVYTFFDKQIDPNSHIIGSYMWTSPYLNYMIGLSVEDGDQMSGFTTDPSFPSNGTSPEYGWTISTMAPVMTSSWGDAWHYHWDTQVYDKKALRDWLANKYGTIAAMNASWGSNYTTFDSSGTNITGEIIGNGDGATTAFSHTVANMTPSRFSTQVAVNGTVIAGEHNNHITHYSNLKDVSAGMITGPQVTGTTTYATGAVVLKFTPASVSLNNCKTDGNTVSVETKKQHGFWTGAKVTLSGTTNCTASNQPVTVVDPWHFTFSKAGTFNPEYNGSATVLIPQSGDVITINYVQNGYRLGTGYLDEDGRHSWIGTEYFKLTKTAPNVAADFRAFLISMSDFYFGNTAATLHARYPNLMYMNQIGAWSIPPRAGALQGSAPHVDLMQNSSVTSFTQEMLNFMYQYYGDKPMLEGIYLYSNPDSGMFPYTNGNSPVLNQEEKGQQFYNMAASIRNAAYPNGSHPYVGYATWGYRDMQSEGKNWGLLTYAGNAYDGHEDVVSMVPCSPPLENYMCGGEPAYPTWQSNTVVNPPKGNYDTPVGNRIQVTLNGVNYVFKVTQAGITGSVQPNWPTAKGATVADGTAIWVNETTKSNANGFGDMISKVKLANALWLGTTPPPPSPDTQAPTVPANLAATAVSYSQINLTWTQSTDNVAVVGYSIYRNGIKVGTSASASYSDTGLSADTSYTYTVLAFDAAVNTSAQSSSVSATTLSNPVPPSPSDTQAPTVPANLKATTVSSSQINLTWTASTDNVGVTGYNVYRSGTKIASVSTVSFSNTNLSPGTSYTYTVSAYDAVGNTSTQSTAVSATTLPSTPPSVNKFNVGDRVHTTAKLKVRQTPTTSGKALCTQPKGAYGSIIGGPQTAGGYIWYQVNYDSLCDGWSVQDWLIK